MGGGVSKMAEQQLVATIRDRYRQSSKKDKGRILDEFTAITGDHRKHGIRRELYTPLDPILSGLPIALGNRNITWDG